MSTALELLHELMTQSLVAWRLTGSVHYARDGGVLISCREHTIRIEPASPDLPFRWIVTVGDRRRAAMSLVSVLRQVRAVLDPGYATMRARIAPVPLVPI
jgi:hypothetical protein